MKHSHENPLVSIIMPAYNSENYIEASITSVINQTYKFWELIVIDDGSTDNTAAIVQTLQLKDDKIIYLYQTNAKQAKARNYGIEKSSGNLLAFLDSDDLWLPEKLERSLANFDYDTYDLLFSESYATEDTIIDLDLSNYKKMGVFAGDYYGNKALKQFIKYNRVPILTVLVRKDKVIEVGGFDGSCVPAEDYDLWLRLLINGAKFKAISIPLSIYRIQNQSSTAIDRLASNSVMLCLIKNFTLKEIQDLNQIQNVRAWIRMWIKMNFTKKRINELNRFLKYYRLMNYKLQTILFFKFFFNTIKLKRILLKNI